MTAPLIIGHRGSSAHAPENTMAAFAQALDSGADGLEFDVRLASDSIPVVLHDATLQRTAAMAGEASALSAAALQQVNVGSWFNRKFPERARAEYHKETIPTLEELLEFMNSRYGLLYLEMKSESHDAEQLAQKVASMINRFGIIDRVIVECFNLPSLAFIKSANPTIRTAALFEPRRQPTSLLRRRNLLQVARDCGTEEIALHHRLATGRLVEQAKQAGIPVVVWTVDSPAWIKRAQKLGVKALITNDPAKMIDARIASAAEKQ